MKRVVSISGPVIVIGMFLFASLVTLGLWSYWNFHTQPFRELTMALAAEFPGSSPRVEGGKHGLHKQTPAVLRVVMRTPFNPKTELEQTMNHLVNICAQIRLCQPDQEIELCEIHLFQQQPERAPVLFSVQFPGAELRRSRTDWQNILLKTTAAPAAE